MISRDRTTVWAELEAGDHPAWTGPPDERPRRVEGTPFTGVGAAWIAVAPPPPGATVRQVIYGETIAATPLVSVTTELIWPTLRYVETLSLRDTVDGTTLATVRGTLEPNGMPADAASLVAGRIHVIAEKLLDRAAQWRPGVGHTSSVFHDDPNDPLTG